MNETKWTSIRPFWDFQPVTYLSVLFKLHLPPIDVAAVTSLVGREFNVAATLGYGRSKMNLHRTSMRLLRCDFFKSQIGRCTDLPLTFKSWRRKVDVPLTYMWHKICDVEFATLWPGSEVAATLISRWEWTKGCGHVNFKFKEKVQCCARPNRA